MSKDLNLPDEILAKLLSINIRSVEDLLKATPLALESLRLEYHDAVVLRDALYGLGYQVILLPYGIPGEVDRKALEALGRIILDYHLRAQITASALADKVIEWIDNQSGGPKK
jgi:hypothetical protein